MNDDAQVVSESESVVVAPVEREVIAVASDVLTSIPIETHGVPVVVEQSEPVAVSETVSEVVVVTVGEQGAPGISEAEMAFERRTHTISDAKFYKGEAQPGTDEDVIGWRVRSFELVGADDDLVETWLGGSARFIHKWSDILDLVA